MLNLTRAVVGSPVASSLKNLHSFASLASCLRVSRVERAAYTSNAVLSRFLLERLCEPDKVFVDVGCHIGSVIAGVRQNSRPISIHAVEANPEKAEFIQKTFAGCHVHACAAGPENKQTTFFIPNKKDGNSSLDPDFAARGGTDIRDISVPMRRLDEIVPPDNVSVLKLDVEGSELGALIGAERIIEKSRPTIFFESGAEVSQDYPRDDLFAWFVKNLYHVFIPMRISHLGDPCDLATFNYSHSYPPLTIDYIAVPMEHRTSVMVRARGLLRMNA